MTNDLERRDPPFFDLRQVTEARVLLGRFGAGIPTRAAQSFLLDHARARKAVWSTVDWAALRADLADIHPEIVAVASRAGDRSTYIRRPDLGRLLAPESEQRLVELRADCDVVIVVADGLSASAVTVNAVPLVRAIVAQLRAKRLSLAPLVLASMGRVALGDPVAESIGAKIAVTIIGERPGLSSADSLGVYITYAPRPGTPDSKRNCISNIRHGGLSFADAATVAISIIVESIKNGASGLELQQSILNNSILQTNYLVDDK